MGNYYINKMMDYRPDGTGTTENPLKADVIYLYNIPDVDNSAGMNWRDAYLQSEDPNAEGIAPLIRNIDDINPSIRGMISSGAVAQYQETLEFENIPGGHHKTDLTDQERLDQIIARGAEIETDILGKLQQELKHTGFNNLPTP